MQFEKPLGPAKDKKETKKSINLGFAKMRECNFDPQ